MNTVKPASLNTPRNALAPNAEPLELVQRDDAVLTGGESSDRRIPVDPGDFLTHVRA